MLQQSEWIFQQRKKKTYSCFINIDKYILKLVKGSLKVKTLRNFFVLFVI